MSVAVNMRINCSFFTLIIIMIIIIIILLFS